MMRMTLDKLLGLVPKELWVLDSTDMERIHSGSFIKITIDKDKPLSNIHQYPLRQEAIEGIKSLILTYIEKRLIVPCSRLPFCWLKKCQGLEVCIGLDIPGDSDVKNLPAMQRTWVQSLGWKDPLEKGMETPLQYSCLENSVDRGLQSMWLQIFRED